MGSDLRVVGQRVAKTDAVAKVVGRARYTDDLTLPGMLYARLARSIETHARVVDVDSTAALALPGVVAVQSSADATFGFAALPPYDPACHDFEREEPFQPLPGDARLFPPVVRYVGEPVAAVVADSDATAVRAASLVDVRYETLPAVVDPEAALAPDAPRLHEDAPGNVVTRVTRRLGDVDAALGQAALVVERRFSTSKQKQAQMEPTCCVVEPTADGGVTIWAPLQAPHRARLTLANLFGLDLGRVRIINPDIGGAFGKGDALTAEPYAVALALETGRPVKLRFSRTEDFVGTESRHPTVTDVVAGFADDGTLLALRAGTLVDGGAYRSHSPRIAVVLAGQLAHLYGLEHLDIDVTVVFTNTPVSGAFRGYGGPQAAFPLEHIIDVGAREVGVDPIAARRRTLARAAATGADAGVSAALLACVEAGAKAVDWDDERARRSAGTMRRGVGMAWVAWKSGTADKPGALDQSGALVHLDPDGSVTVASAACDLGTGVKTTLAQICAEVLGVPWDLVTVTASDTAITPYDSGAHASRSLYRAGQAVVAAASDARDKVLAYAGEVLEADPADLELRDGWLRVRGAGRHGMALGALLRRGLFEGRDFHGHGQTPKTNARTSAAQFAVVDLDTETGRVMVRRLVAVQDVGRAINPTVVEGQMQGAAHQGMGYALTEEMVVDRSTGAVLTGSFMDYRLQTAADGPRVESIFLEHPDPTGPFGAKGMAEPSIILTAPAISNAILDATGVSVTDLPMTPERVFRALRMAGKEAQACRPDSGRGTDSIP
jgi:xanthine dehydrogenase molybdenum-binding subunit